MSGVVEVTKARIGSLLALLVAALFVVNVPTMASAATVGTPSPATTYDASHHVYDGSLQHGRASTAAAYRDGAQRSSWSAATAAPFRVRPVRVAANSEGYRHR